MTYPGTIYISIANNDDQGQPTAAAHRIDFMDGDGEFICQLEARDEKGERVRVTAADGLGCGRIETCGIMVKYMGYQPWAGNRLWNGMHVPEEYALGLMNALRNSRQWDCTSAFTPVFDKWNGRDDITWEDMGLSHPQQPQVLPMKDMKDIQIKLPL